jgi:hypothetical protein
MSRLHLVTAAGEAVAAATERLELLADTASDAEYDQAFALWFDSIRAFSGELQTVTGLSAAQLAERLVG